MFGLSLPLRLVLSVVLNSLAMCAMDAYLPQYVAVFGGVGAFVIIGALLTLMNFFLRPLLNLIGLPFKLIATLITDLIINGVFLWLVYQITLKMDPSLVALTVSGGIKGWIIVGILLGLVNWAIKKIL